MAIPKFEDFLYPFMHHLMAKDSNKPDMIAVLANHFNLSEEDKLLKTKGGTSYQLNDRVGWSLQWLRRALFVEIPERGVWRITQRGREYMSSHNDLRESDLMEYPEFAEYSRKRNDDGNQNHSTKVQTNSDDILLKQNDNWFEIVETIKPVIIDEDLPYSSYYNAVITCFRLLGWKKSKGTIVTLPSIKPNVNEALLLLNIEGGKIRIPVLPMDIRIVYSEGFCQEVMSMAMKEMKCSIGLLFYDSIQLYYKNNEEEPVRIFTVQFDENEKNGFVLCNLLSFQSFSQKRLECFCKSEYEKNPSFSNMLERLLAICHDSQLISKMLKENLIAEGFCEDTVSALLTKYTFSIGIKNMSDGKKELISDSQPKAKRDNTRFSIDGGKTFYKKRNFVLMVIRQYIKDHPSSSLDDLEKVFPSELISKTRGVVRPLSLVQQWIIDNPDVESRYFMAPDEVITLQDGMKIVVHNQWGDHFPKFLKVAQRLYDVKSDRPYPYLEEKPLISEMEMKEKHGIKISADSMSKFKRRK